MRIVTDLRNEILAQLKKVNKNNAPGIFALLNEPNGYLTVESRIIDMVIADSITPSACIAHLESEM